MFGCYYSTGGKKIPRRFSNRNQSLKAIQRFPLCLTESDHDYIIEEIKPGDTIEYDIKMSVGGSYEQL